MEKEKIIELLEGDLKNTREDRKVLYSLQRREQDVLDMKYKVKLEENDKKDFYIRDLIKKYEDTK